MKAPSRATLSPKGERGNVSGEVGQDTGMTIDAYCALGIDREYDLVAERLIEEMDKAAVDRAVVAPIDRNLAVRNRQGNDDILAAAAGYPGRLIPACSVNPWFGDEAAAELRRAITSGSRMLVLHPFLPGQ
jgi:predicted TIM-barrel fold metal-dependent hydrolase